MVERRYTNNQLGLLYIISENARILSREDVVRLVEDGLVERDQSPLKLKITDAGRRVIGEA